jgi:hypothetical protein
LTPTAIWVGDITATAFGANATAGDATNDIVTFNSHGLTTGTSILLSGSPPAGLTVNAGYYIRALTANTFSLYNTLADAKADTSRVNITGTNLAFTFRSLVYSNVWSVGFDAVAPIAATPGPTSMAFDLNLSNPLAAAVGLLVMSSAILFTTAGAGNAAWQMKGRAVGANGWSMTSTILVQIGATALVSAAGTNQGTWAQQGTNTFTFGFVIWG